MSETVDLFTPITFKGLTLANRIVVSPMCQYSSEDGFANDWHLVHLGSRATGGAGLLIVEATAVSPEGRISPQDLGLWKNDHIARLQQIVRFVHSQGAHLGMQLAHAGRKASMSRPWDGEEHVVAPEQGGWTNLIGPSAIAFSPRYLTPQAMDTATIARVVDDFGAAARRSLEAGFDLIEVHSAHGYLLHEFLSPLSNQRTDEYGGSFENRTRLLLMVVATIRDQIPGDFPLFVRISATDWAEGGWDIEQSVALAGLLKKAGVDLIDVSTGALVPGVKIPVGPGFQTPFAERIKKEAEIPTGTVGMITECRAGGPNCTQRPGRFGSAGPANSYAIRTGHSMQRGNWEASRLASSIFACR